MGAGVGNANAESCGVVRPLRIPLVIRPVRRVYVVVVSRRATRGEFGAFAPQKISKHCLAI